MKNKDFNKCFTKKRNKKRIDIIMKNLTELWKKYPQQRLGQLLENEVFIHGKRGAETCFLFYQEDDETAKLLECEDFELWVNINE